MQKEITIEINYVLYADPDEVFRALTNPGMIKKWSGEDAVFELKKDGQVTLFDGWVTGNVLNFDPGKAVTHTWKPAEWKSKKKPSVVEYRLVPHEAGTRLSIVHTGFPGQDEADKHREGWVNFVLEPLNDFLIR